MGPFRTLFLDLDDTLYPRSSGLWEALSQRILTYLVQRLGLSEQEAGRLRRSYLETYGTTLKGLITEHRIEPHDYLDFVHDIPVEELLEPDPALAAMLHSLHPQRVVFTNASRRHVDRVTHRLGVDREIDLVIDIEALGYHNKPFPEAYLRAMALSGESSAPACLILDDRIQNLIPAGELGMTTVLVGQDGQHPAADYRIARAADLTRVVPSLIVGG